jgi:uncharacterized protein YlxW (UPF0749 family)
MMSEMDTATQAVFGVGGIGAVFVMLKFFLKQGAGGLLDMKEMGARNDILEDLRTEMKSLRERVNELEIKVGKLQDRLVIVRTHALTAYGIVQNQHVCNGCQHSQRDMLLELLTKIIKED